MNLMLGKSLVGRFILQQPNTTSGSGGGGDSTYTYPVIDDAFYVAIYNSSGQIIKYLGSDIFESPLVEINFKLTTTGCGDFTLTLDKESASLLTTNQRISIFMFGEQTPRYTGYVMERALVGSTSETLEISGYGYYSKLEKLIVNKTYESVEIMAAVTDLIKTVISPKTGITYNTLKMVATDFTLTGQQFAYATAKDVIETLAEYTDDYVYGVDHLMEFFFKPRTTTINENSRIWVGKHCTTFEPSEDTSDIVNYFYVKYGEEQDDGSNYYQDANGDPIAFSDAESITNYGYNEDVLTASTAITSTDVIRWGQMQLQSSKDPARSANVEGFTLDIIKRGITPDGIAVVITDDGTEYQYEITEVEYTLSGDDGVSMTLTLGDKPKGIDTYIQNLIKAQKDADALEALNSATEDE